MCAASEHQLFMSKPQTLDYRTATPYNFEICPIPVQGKGSREQARNGVQG